MRERGDCGYAAKGTNWLLNKSEVKGTNWLLNKLLAPYNNWKDVCSIQK